MLSKRKKKCLEGLILWPLITRLIVLNGSTHGDGRSGPEQIMYCPWKPLLAWHAPTKSVADSHARADATNAEGRGVSLPERIHFHFEPFAAARYMSTCWLVTVTAP